MFRLFFIAIVFGNLNLAFGETGHTGPGASPSPPDARHRPAPAVESRSHRVVYTLPSYGNRLGTSFLRDLASLDRNAHWIDANFGEGVGPEQYLQLGTNPMALRFAAVEGLDSLNLIASRPADQRARVTNLGYHTARERARDYEGRLRHLTGRLIEEIPSEQIGKADLISDVYGPFAYSNRLDRTMEKYLTALKPGGKLYILSAQFDRTTIQLGEGRTTTLLDFLRGISGIRVEQLEGSVRITKTEGPVRIPRLDFVSNDDQSPPARVFRFAGGTIDVPAVAPVVGAGTEFVSQRVAPPSPPKAMDNLTAHLINESLGYTAIPPHR